jgi:hypothetical protein
MRTEAERRIKEFDCTGAGAVVLFVVTDVVVLQDGVVVLHHELLLASDDDDDGRPEPRFPPLSPPFRLLLLFFLLVCSLALLCAVEVDTPVLLRLFVVVVTLVLWRRWDIMHCLWLLLLADDDLGVNRAAAAAAMSPFNGAAAAAAMSPFNGAAASCGCWSAGVLLLLEDEESTRCNAARAPANPRRGCGVEQDVVVIVLVFTVEVVTRVLLWPDIVRCLLLLQLLDDAFDPHLLHVLAAEPFKEVLLFLPWWLLLSTPKVLLCCDGDEASVGKKSIGWCAVN